MSLQVGDKAPDFTLPSTSGEDFHLEEALQKGPLIIYFYPKDFTAGCTKEACGFRDEYSHFEKKGVNIVGISKGSVEKHTRFKQKHSLPFDLLYDHGGEVSRTYGAYIPLIGLVKRVTYFVGQDGRIKFVTNNLFDFKIHVTEMLKKLE